MLIVASVRRTRLGLNEFSIPNLLSVESDEALLGLANDAWGIPVLLHALDGVH